MNKLLFLLMAVCLTGCTFYPLGISEQQWQVMTQEQRHQAYLEQAQLDEAERERRAQLRQAQLVLEEQQLREREQRLQQAVPGDVLQCVLDRVEVDFGKNKWRPANSLAVELLQGEEQTLELERADKNYQRRSLTARYEPLRLRLCDRDGCASLAGTSREFQRGKRQQIQGRSFRAVVKCQYPPHYRAWR